jgi:hypothetical protein
MEQGFVLCGKRRLRDEATCYKAMPTELVRPLDLRAQRFELCVEITAKVCRLGLPILEVPISYRPRTFEEGKKIGWRDAWSTFWTLLRWRFLPLPRPLHTSTNGPADLSDRTAQLVISPSACEPQTPQLQS